jgi:hypothetical protein
MCGGVWSFWRPSGRVGTKFKARISEMLLKIAL